MMSSHLVLRRIGYLHQVLQIFSHIKKYHNSELVNEPTRPEINEAGFEVRAWATSEFGHFQGLEELPPNIPQPRGLGFTMRARVDADHVSDTISRRSRTIFVVYLNHALVYWSLKKNTSVESTLDQDLLR